MELSGESNFGILKSLWVRLIGAKFQLIDGNVIVTCYKYCGMTYITKEQFLITKPDK